MIWAMIGFLHMVRSLPGMTIINYHIIRGGLSDLGDVRFASNGS